MTEYPEYFVIERFSLDVLKEDVACKIMVDEGEMMSRLLVLLLAVVVIGCSGNRVDGHNGLREVCIKGVVYYQDGYRLAPALMPSGSPYLCPGKS